MKTINNTFSLLAVAMLTAGVANAQGPTNTYQGPIIRPVATPGTAPAAPADVPGASKGTYSKTYSDYSQDSYVSQTGSGNYATVDQVSAGGPNNGGSTAILEQNGDNNNAKQTQSAGDPRYPYFNAKSAPYRDFAKATQNGSNSQVDQTQSGGIGDVMKIVQGKSTTGNRAIQTQGQDANKKNYFFDNVFSNLFNQAEINQTKYATEGGGSGNRAEQAQYGFGHAAKIDQEASNSYAKQTQSGVIQQGYIHQGDPGKANTAVQKQEGYYNAARIQQSVSSTANNNYAEQNQTMSRNKADITQESSSNYAEQKQSGMGGNGGYNYSGITQSNVASAAYTTQSGNNNAVVITQH